MNNGEVMKNARRTYEGKDEKGGMKVMKKDMQKRRKWIMQKMSIFCLEERALSRWEGKE